MREGWSKRGGLGLTSSKTSTASSHLSSPGGSPTGSPLQLYQRLMIHCGVLSFCCARITTSSSARAPGSSTSACTRASASGLPWRMSVCPAATGTSAAPPSVAGGDDTAAVWGAGGDGDTGDDGSRDELSITAASSDPSLWTTLPTAYTPPTQVATAVTVPASPMMTLCGPVSCLEKRCENPFGAWLFFATPAVSGAAAHHVTRWSPPQQDRPSSGTVPSTRYDS